MKKRKIEFVFVKGTAKGENSAEKAMRDAIVRAQKSIKLSNISEVVFRIIGDKELNLLEVNNAAECLFNEIHSNADILFDAWIDPSYKNNTEVNILAKAKSAT